MCLTAATRGRLKIAKTRHSKFITCVEVLLKKWTMRLCKLSHVHSLLRLFFHARSRVSRLRTIGPTGESSLSRNVAPPRVCSDRSAERDAKHAGVSSMTRVHARTHARTHAGCAWRVCTLRVCVQQRGVWWYHPLNAKPPAGAHDSPLVQATNGQWPRSCTRARYTRRIPSCIPNRTENALRGPA